MADEASAHGEAPAGGATVSSEREFRDRLFAALRRGSARDMVGLWKDDHMEPHMTLFVLLTLSVLVGAVLWVVEPMLI